MNEVIKTHWVRHHGYAVGERIGKIETVRKPDGTVCELEYWYQLETGAVTRVRERKAK